MYPTLPPYAMAVYAVLIATFTLCGVLRCCNLWPGNDRSADELFPARKMTVATYFSVLLLLPCLLHPHSHDALLLGRCFWIVWIPVVSSLSLKRLFSQTDDCGKRHVLLVGGVPGAVLLLLSAIATIGGDTLFIYTRVVSQLAVCLGALLAAYLIYVGVRSWRQASANSLDDNSAATPQPKRVVTRRLLPPMLSLLAAWVIYLLDSPAANVAMTAYIAMTGAATLVVILHPQHAAPACIAIADEVAPAEAVCKLPVQQVDRIERQVRSAVEDGKMFLQPDLTKSMVLERLSTNSLYLHIVLKQRFGSFNKYVNTLRLKYSMDYQKRHPDAKQEEVAMKCGFGSVRTYYRAKKRYSADVTDN